MTAEDFSILERWFADTCSTYYTSVPADDRNIRLKEEHTGRVVENMSRLAEALGLEPGERRVAMAVALLHDVGRFEQYRRFRTFRDRDSVNHAALGVQILKEAGVLESLSQDEQHLIMGAVSLHNAFLLPADLRERRALMVKLIRDADKLDIWRVFIEYYATPEEERASAAGLGFPDLPHCSPEVVAEVSAGKMVDLALLTTLNDFKLLQLSWVYDLNFPLSFRLLLERGYVSQLTATLPREHTVLAALEKVASFIDRQCRTSDAAAA